MKKKYIGWRRPWNNWTHRQLPSIAQHDKAHWEKLHHPNQQEAGGSWVRLWLWCARHETAIFESSNWGIAGERSTRIVHWGSYGVGHIFFSGFEFLFAAIFLHPRVELGRACQSLADGYIMGFMYVQQCTAHVYITYLHQCVSKPPFPFLFQHPKYGLQKTNVYLYNSLYIYFFISSFLPFFLLSFFLIIIDYIHILSCIWEFSFGPRRRFNWWYIWRFPAPWPRCMRFSPPTLTTSLPWPFRRWKTWTKGRISERP